jgi:hypothetical protein
MIHQGPCSAADPQQDGSLLVPPTAEIPSASQKSLNLGSRYRQIRIFSISWRTGGMGADQHQFSRLSFPRTVPRESTFLAPCRYRVAPNCSGPLRSLALGHAIVSWSGRGSTVRFDGHQGVESTQDFRASTATEQSSPLRIAVDPLPQFLHLPQQVLDQKKATTHTSHGTVRKIQPFA